MGYSLVNIQIYFNNNKDMKILNKSLRLTNIYIVIDKFDYINHIIYGTIIHRSCKKICRCPMTCTDIFISFSEKEKKNLFNLILCKKIKIKYEYKNMFERIIYTYNISKTYPIFIKKILNTKLIKNDIYLTDYILSFYEQKLIIKNNTKYISFI